MLKQALVAYDRTLLVADNRRCEPKKFGGMFFEMGMGFLRWVEANVLDRSWGKGEISKVVPLRWLWKWEWGVDVVVCVLAW